MLIEYKFKFEKNGLTLTQRVESGVSYAQGTGGDFVEENSLKASFQESKAASATQPSSGGSGFGSEPGGNGSGPPDDFGTTPVTLVGPFIMCCPCDGSKRENKD